MADQTFTSGQILTAAQMTTLQSNTGLVQMTPTGVTNATLSGATATIGAAVASVTITGCFTTAFTNYRIVLSGMAASVDGATFKLTLNGSTGSTYSTVGFNQDYGTATLNGFAASAGLFIRACELSTIANSFVLEVMQPFAATQTATNSTWNGSAHAGLYFGRDTGTVSQTAFTLTPSSGTITGGTITVYGYR